MATTLYSMVPWAAWRTGRLDAARNAARRLSLAQIEGDLGGLVEQLAAELRLEPAILRWDTLETKAEAMPAPTVLARALERTGPRVVYRHEVKFSGPESSLLLRPTVGPSIAVPAVIEGDTVRFTTHDEAETARVVEALREAGDLLVRDLAHWNSIVGIEARILVAHRGRVLRDEQARREAMRPAPPVFEVW